MLFLASQSPTAHVLTSCLHPRPRLSSIGLVRVPDRAFAKAGCAPFDAHNNKHVSLLSTQPQRQGSQRARNGIIAQNSRMSTRTWIDFDQIEAALAGRLLLAAFVLVLLGASLVFLPKLPILS